MALREETQKRKFVPALVAVLLLCVAGTVTALQFYYPSHVAPPPRSYFYDLTSDKLFVARSGPTPMVGPSGDKGDGGGTAVWAHVMSCGGCANEADRYVAYLENRSSEFRSPGAAKPTPGQAFNSAERRRARESRMEVADPAQKQTWVGETTPEGQAIIAGAESKCGEGKQAQVCVPPAGSAVQGP